MCYAIPGKVVSIEGENAVIDYDGIKKKANISLVEAKVGDYVLVHAGFAIEKLDNDYAKKTLELMRQIE